MHAINENMRTAGGRSGARSIAVWDPLVRLIHWGVALTILLNGAIVEEESNLHEWIGYTAVTLVAVRLVWGLIGPAPARFSAFPPSIAAAVRHIATIMRGEKHVHLSHNPVGALMVYNLWATVLVMGVTGYMMTTTAFFGVDWVENVHEIAFNWLSVVLHVGGVVYDTWRSGVPLLPAMIHGRKKVPDDIETI
jgi:cytochrome b